ncbi:MAG: hypothetical protein KA004_03800 [Verrucomicrobiales bacterium]|nr:hypothetical protein [Verrucomicrobiales bacterium]
MNAPHACTPTGLLERYANQVEGTLSCLDRVVITGTLVEVAHADAVTARLAHEGILCFDIKEFADPLRRQICERAKSLATDAGLEVEFIRRKNFRKDERVAAILEKRGRHPGLVHVFSAMENCTAFEPWHDRQGGRASVRATSGKCLHFYFYFMHARLGLIDVRVQTWLPCRIQIYFNGHNALALRLGKAGIGYTMEDNAFVQCDDWAGAQQLADDFDLSALHCDLDTLAAQCVPFLHQFPAGYHWSLMQVKYATDLVWKSREALAPVYAEISRQAILTVKAPDVAKFLGRPLPKTPDTQVGSDFSTRVEGTRIKHFFGPASLKLYDKRGRVLRIECTANDVTFFKHHRKVEHCDGTVTSQLTPLKQSIDSLGDLRGLLGAANTRYLQFLSDLEDRSEGPRRLDKITTPISDGNKRRSRGFNLFCACDLEALLAVFRGEHLISGMTNKRLRPLLPGWSSGKISRLLKPLRLHEVLKKIGKTYKYSITGTGRRLLLALLKICEHLIIPTLAAPA